MAKKALCVGIDHYTIKGQDLKGCVNDAEAWAELLIDHYDFPSPDVEILRDDQATKTNIMTALKNLLAGAKPGDVLVYVNSSHGTYLADTSGDEKMYDEALCPFDCMENQIVDDELREMFATLADNVRLTVISDSCYSGSVTRGSKNSPDSKFLDPSLIRKSTLNIHKAKLKGATKHKESEMKDVLLSACEDKQEAKITNTDGVYHGVMSYYALKAIREANYQITYQELNNRVKELINASPYRQSPQLEGKQDRKESQIFT